MAKNAPIEDLFQIYSWVATNQESKTIKGSVRAESEDKAAQQIAERGLSLISIKQKPMLLVSRAQQRPVSQEDLNLFFRQLATMIMAGIPLVQALDFVARGVDNLKMASLVMTLHNDVASGNTLGVTLEKYPKFFNELVVSLIKVGETSGTLDHVLLRIANYLERIASLKAKIKKAMYYPLIIVVVMVALAGMLLTFIVPRFQGMFESFGKELPKPTQVIIALSNGLQNYWWLMLLIVIAIAAIHILLKKQSEKYRIFLAQASLKIPIFGVLIQKAIIARSTRTLSVTLGAGVPLSDALISTAGVANNLIYAAAIDKIRERVVAGNKMADALRETDLFPNMVIQMISVGEHSGTLESMLGKIADFYDEQVDSAVDNISSLIEPVMILLLGIIVGGFVISMYLPIFKIGTLV